MRAMQVNHALLLKNPVDRHDVERRLTPVLEGRELTYDVFESPPGVVPWVSFSFTGHHGVHEALAAEVEAVIEQAGLADRVEPA